MRILAGPPVLRTSAPAPNYTQWHEPPANREREGLYPGANIVRANMPGGVRYSARDRYLSDDELWSVYRQVPEVRASIESIVRLISTWDWSVAPPEDLSPADPLYEAAIEESARVQRFLKAPNEDGETWQVLISKVARDLLIYDVLAMENALADDGSLEEIVSLPGRTIHPKQDRNQRLVGYVQSLDGTETGGADVVFFDPEQIVYMNLFPSTERPGGMPLIETLINEIITLLRASKHLMLAYDADEVAPGVLLIAGLAGKAADRAVEGLKNMRGSDHKLRVLTTNNPKGLDAKWVEFRHTPKDLDMKDLVHEVRRTVWRLFGVKPITMGDSEATPRATAEVQVTSEDSGLIRPILEQLQALVNMRVVPLIVDNPDIAEHVHFGFDLEKGQTADEKQKTAEADGTDFDRGGLTINELRAKRGRDPVDGGDIVLIKSSGGYSTLESMLEADDDVDDGDGTTTDGFGEDDDENGDDAENDAENDEDEDAPGAAEQKAIPMVRGAHRRRTGLRAGRGKGCACGSHRSEPSARIQRAAEGGLPSAWQPEGRFKDVRTVDLSRLGVEIIDYRTAITPLYRRARIDVTQAFQSYLADNRLTAQEAQVLGQRISSSLDKLSTQWDAATGPMYREASRTGRDAAVHFTGVQVAQGWRAAGDAYQARAMRYLNDPGGLISDLRAQLMSIIAANVRGTPEWNYVGKVIRRDADEDEVTLLVLGAVGKVFARNEHRIDNWSGRLVELSNATMLRGMDEGMAGDGGGADDGTGTGTGGGGEQREEWWVEWSYVGDRNSCATCEAEGIAGYRPISQLTTEPGGQTECRARCRCVLVYWTKAEIDSGAAVSLTGLG